MRPWIKSYTNLISNSTYMNLTAGSKALWHDAALWCGLNGSDGVIPALDVKWLKGTASKINGLIEAGFWEEVQGDDGGVAYSIVGWLDEQDSVEKANKNREGGRNRTAKSRAKSRSSRAQVETKWGSSGDQVESESAPSHAQVETNSRSVELHLNDQKRSDQQEQASVTALEESREEEIRRDESVCLHDRPEGGAHTLKNKNETKDESEGKTTPNRPRNGMDQLAARFPAPRTSSAEVDVSATEDQDTSSWDSRELAIGKPLERMSPRDLLRYIVLSQDEINGIKLSGSGSKGAATMKRFQNQYGPERAAAIMRHLFVKERGRYEVGKNGIEHITQNHFTEPLSWFTDKVDVKAQAKDRRRKGMASEFIFATEL